MDLIADLDARGLIHDSTDREFLSSRLAEGPIGVYVGFDPTADSLHVGHLVGQLTLRRFQLAGHHPLPLAGGATGMIGDPSGKSAERNLLTPDQIAHNVSCIKRQLASLLDFEAGSNPARLVDNATWTAPLSYLEFLREIGKHFSVNVMIAKDSVRGRMEGESGISYTEFSYQLLQAFDFLHLRRAFDCELQIGGSDQWGNITAGCDLIRKKLGHETTAWGLTFGEPKVDLDKMRSFKDGVVQKLTGGNGQLVKARKITYVQGMASFVDGTTLEIEGKDGKKEKKSFEGIIIATGSHPTKVPNISIDNPKVLDSTSALDLPDIPKRFVG